MTKYRKTALVEAQQFLPPHQIPEGCYQDGSVADVAQGHGQWRLETLEGQHPLRPGDYICVGARNECWNVEQSIFEETYEPVNEGEPIAADEQAYHDEHLRFSIRNSALAFAIQNQGKGGDPKKLVAAAQTFAEFLEDAATDPVMPELKPTLKMRDGSEPPPHVARMIDEYLELDERRKKIERFIEQHPLFRRLTPDEQLAMVDQANAMNDYYAALMRRLAYAGAMTS